MKIYLGTSYSFCQKGQRDYQEDCRFPAADYAPASQRFFIVCDGVGGSTKGEVASNAVCQAIGRAMKEISLDDVFSSDDFRHVLDVAYDSLDNTADNGNLDMGTTMTFICFHADGCTMAHIGDSRIYQVRPSEGIIYRSDDHSLVNSLVHSGMVSPDEAGRHPQRNVITRYMEPVESDQNRCMATLMLTADVKSGDYFLLCTDGVFNQISDDNLVALLTGVGTDEEKMRKLADNSRDSEDNNTAWLIRVKSVEDDEGDEMLDSEETTGISPNTMRLTMKTRRQEEIVSIQHKENSLKKWFNKLTKSIKLL